MKYPYDQPGIYAVHVAGRVDTSWSECLGGLTITYAVDEEQDGETMTVLTGWLPDQAALLGVLSALYNARYPLLFVRYLRQGKPIQAS